MMRKYEFVFVLAKIEDGLKKEVLKKIRDLIEGQKGKIEKEESWGEKKLAYRIKKQTEGEYFFYHLELKPETFAKIEKKIKQEENILRYLFTRVT
jgi:small subunit ribosomal protein S6